MFHNLNYAEWPAQHWNLLVIQPVCFSSAQLCMTEVLQKYRLR